MSKKIAFINQRYGVEVLGGSETYTRKTAEALALRDGFDVEVLTSKALDFKTWADYFEKDVEEINGVTVMRPHGLHLASLPGPSLSPGICSN